MSSSYYVKIHCFRPLLYGFGCLDSQMLCLCVDKGTGKKNLFTTSCVIINLLLLKLLYSKQSDWKVQSDTLLETISYMDSCGDILY